MRSTGTRNDLRQISDENVCEIAAQPSGDPRWNSLRASLTPQMIRQTGLPVWRYHRPDLRRDNSQYRCLFRLSRLTDSRNQLAYRDWVSCFNSSGQFTITRSASVCRSASGFSSASEVYRGLPSGLLRQVPITIKAKKVGDAKISEKLAFFHTQARCGPGSPSPRYPTRPTG
jgi:hypothetical protein